jgi:hypothetical protein
MCRGGRLVADFVAGTNTAPEVPEEIQEHLTMTTDGQWVVWAHKVARQCGDLFVPLRGGGGYPADARAECRQRRTGSTHAAPDPMCRCGFHALSDARLPGLPTRGGLSQLTVALSGRVLAFEWPGNGAWAGTSNGVLWRAERQTVVRVGRPVVTDPFDEAADRRRWPDDPEGRLAARPVATPRDSGPVRLSLPVSCPVVLMQRDDAGWCAQTRTPMRSPTALALV